MKKKIILLGVLFAFLGVVTVFYVKKKTRYTGYDSIGGKKVTIENFHLFLKKTPKEIEKKVRQWFATHPNAYKVLVRQEGFLGDISKKLKTSEEFFAVHKDIANTSAINYIFKVPRETFFLKISGPNNRFTNSVYNMGLGCRLIYSRSLFGKGKKNPEAKPVCLDEDKQVIMRCFKWCCPQNLLKKKPTKSQVRVLIALVVGALPREELMQIVEPILVDTFFKIDTFKPKTIEETFKVLVDYAFRILKEICYDNKILMSKKCIDTYQTASRFFHQQRFNEAIDLFNLNALEHAPETYVINISSGPRHRLSCSDEYVVLAQKAVPDYYKPLDFYTKGPQDLLDAVFSREAFLQLLQGLKYAGCNDINGKNVYVNSKTKKITYIDFEQYGFTEKTELFNKKEGIRRRNLYGVLIGFFKQFKATARQAYYLHSFIQKKWPEFYTYKEARRGFPSALQNQCEGKYDINKRAISCIVFSAHKDVKLCMRLKKYIQNILIKAGKEVL